MLREELEAKKQEISDLDEAVRELENQIDLATKTALASAQEHFDEQVISKLNYTN